eukprot:COSAG02_NODE_31266_length_536_cov_1.183066_1_plen_65_part_10
MGLPGTGDGVGDGAAFGMVMMAVHATSDAHAAWQAGSETGCGRLPPPVLQQGHGSGPGTMLAPAP